MAEEFERPADLTEKEIKFAKSGKSKEVLLSKSCPKDMTEKEVKMAKEGRSEEVFKKN